MAEKRIMKNEFDAVRDAQKLREMSDDAANAKRAMDQAEQMDKVMDKIKAGKQKAPSFNDMSPLPPPVKMPELKTKDTGDKMEVEIKSEKIKGYENAKPIKKGGAIKSKKYAKGGSVSSASKRADGCATKGKTKGRII